MFIVLYVAICTVMADIRLKATGIVMDAQGINIAGAYVKLSQQNMIVGSTQTKEDGSYEFALSVAQQEKYQFSLETSLVNNLQTPIITQCTPIQKENELTINQDIKLTVDDVTVSGPAVIAKINGQYFNKTSSLPLSSVTIDYEINYQDKTAGLTKFTLPGVSNDQGISKLFTIYPKGPAVLKIQAQKENFWTYHQTKENDEKFTLIVSQEYKVNYVVTMEEGLFNQKVLGTIVNKNTVKPLGDVKVVVTFSSESKGLLQKMNQMTDSTGKFEINYQTKLWRKFIIQIEFLKEFYAHNEMTKQIIMDHEDRSKVADIWDLGIVKLPVQPQVKLDGLVIDAYKKPVSNLKISLMAVCLDIQTNFDVTTDNAGHWEAKQLQLEPSSNYQLTMKYKVKSEEEISNQFKFSTTEDPQQSITINPLYYETLVDAEISGQFNLEKDMLPLKIPIIISCLNDDSESKIPDLMKGITDFQQKFDMKWQVTRRFDQTLSCSITNENSQISQSFVKNVILKATDWKDDEKITLKYNIFKQLVQGIVKDQTKLAKYLGEAKISFKIYQKDANLHTQTQQQELVSNVKDGSFQISFFLAKGEKSFISVKATHPDFQDFIKDDIVVCNADKDITVDSDLEMKRIEQSVILSYKVNTLQQPATLSLKTSEPLMSYETLYSPKTYSSTDGSFKITFTCYQNIDYTVKFELHITSFSSQMYDSNPFKCVIPTKEKPEIEVTSESLFIPGRFTVKFFDVNNKPAQGIEGKFQTKPISQLVTQKSGNDGVITFQDVYLFKNQDYTGLLQYQDPSGHQLSAEIKFYTRNINDIYPFQDQSLAGQVVFTISGKLTLDRGQLVNPVQVSVTCDHSITASGTTSLDGSFKVQFERQTNFEDTVKCKATFSGDIEPVSYEITFTKGKYSDSHDIQTKLKDLQLNINGQFIDPINKPKSDLSIDLSLEATGLATEKQTLKTNPKGEFIVKGKSIKANQQYTIKLLYKNGAQQEISVTQLYKSSVFTLKPIDDFNFPITYIQDFENCHAFGQIDKPQNILPVQVPLAYKCNSIEKTNKNILGIVQSTYDFKYDIKFDGLVQFDKPLECEISSGNEKVAKLNQKININGPKWEVQQNFKIQFISWKIHISGDSVDSTGIEKNLKETKITITVHQKQKQISYLRGLNHFLTQTTDFSTVSANQGSYEFSFEILNEEVLVADIKATHIDFVDFAQIDAVEISGKKDEELKYQIKLQRVQFQAILSGTAEETGSMYIKETNPKMSNDQYNIKNSVTSSKPFQVKFECYQNVEYTAKFVIENEHKQNIEYISDPFKCKKAPELTSITLKSLNDKIDLDISGKVTDKEKIIDSVEGAILVIEIKKQEKVVQKAELKTNNQGVYNYKFTLRLDTYIVKYSISHPQFIDQTQSKDIHLSSNIEIKTDFILERVVQTQKIKINLKDGNGKPIKESSVTATGFSPKPLENIVVKGDVGGVATVEVQCFKGVDETFEMQVTVQDLKETSKQSVSCTGISGERSVTLSSQYITIGGQIIDPFGQGKSDLDLKLITQPASQQQILKSIQGNWNSELLVSLDKSYNFILTYNGWDNTQMTEQQTAPIKSGETNINYHIIYFKDMIESTLNGKVESKKYHISLKFHKVFLINDGKEVANIEIDQFDEYQLKYKFVAAFNQKYDFSLQIKETQKFKQEIVPFTIIPPKYKMSIDITVSETEAYINEIKTHFSKYLLKGYLGSEYNCVDKIHRAVQHASVSIVKKGQDGNKVKAATHTGDDGKFQMYFFLSKKQVENNIIVWLYIEKEGFISPSPQLIMPSQFERFQIDEETITNIDVGYQSISPIHDMGCPTDLPTLTSDNLDEQIMVGKKLKSSN